MAKADKKKIAASKTKTKTKKSKKAKASKPDTPIPAPKEETPKPTLPAKPAKAARAKPKVEPWLLICPRNNWRHPIPYDPKGNPLLLEIASRLGLVHSADPDARKFYMDLPVKPLPKTGMPLRKGPNDWLSDNFHISEFHCKDGTKVPSWGVPRFKELCDNVLEHIRTSPALEGGKIVVTSAYRHRAYNASIGGARYSQHIECRAADIYCPELEEKYGSRRMVEILVRIARGTKATGIGTSYDNFVHVDIRPGPRVEW